MTHKGWRVVKPQHNQSNYGEIRKKYLRIITKYTSLTIPLIMLYVSDQQTSFVQALDPCNRQSSNEG